MDLIGLHSRSLKTSCKLYSAGFLDLAVVLHGPSLTTGARLPTLLLSLLLLLTTWRPPLTMGAPSSSAALLLAEETIRGQLVNSLLSASK